MDRSARLPWHSKGLLNDRFLSMDFTRICRVEGSRVQWWRKGKKKQKKTGSGWTRNTHLIISWSEFRGGGAVTHHSGEAGDERDAVLHLLLGDLHRRAVLLLQRKRVCAVLTHPRMQLKPTEILWFISNTDPYQRERPYTRSHLDFWDGDPCFWVLIQHPLNELLQLLADQRPKREVTLLLLNAASPQAHFDQSGTKKHNTANVASAGLLTSLGTPRICSWSCCTERRYIGRRKDTVKGQILKKNAFRWCWALNQAAFVSPVTYPSKDKAEQRDSHRPHV